MTSVPVIFLAFANDRNEGGAYLRNLPLELDGIRKALQPAQQAGLCEIVERANATADQILDIFQSGAYRNRIAVFHYGGHANGFQLLLESLDGSSKSGSSEGLVPFLARQRGLRLVFLNGCSSQQQAQNLMLAGVPAVIGTSQSINDDVATSLAVRFYKGLGQGQELQRAWDESIDSVKLNSGASLEQGNLRDLYWEGAEDDLSAERFPWELQVREGSEIVKGWNLPDTVGNPLYNLPPIPHTYSLPETPFLFFRRYERKHAPVFFGRSFYIRDLYHKVTSDKAPPVLLLYGQSGVGKSSLFDAGLKPRLEGSHEVRYLRRDAKKGLTHGLMELLNELAGEGDQNPELPESKVQDQEGKQARPLDDLIAQLELSLEKAPPSAQPALQEALRNLQETKAKEDNLAQKRKAVINDQELAKLPSPLREWRQAEKKLNRPLLLILDQVEELFTQPRPEQPNELEDLLDLLLILFGDPSLAPQGKVLLGYRKEYNPEIEEAFKQKQIPRNRLFLESLKKRDILEIFHGLGTTPALQERYGLEIEDALPDIIADDLLEDKDSAVAPVLQILLTKMWEEALKDSVDKPQFTVDRYQGLRREGILLEDFFQQQVQRLREWAEEVELSGLALDVLHYHTTRLGTSGSRNLEELRERYRHREEIMDKLLEKFKELYLLNDSGRNATSLAHDTIAPLVQREYRYSDRPGQRASRILNNKAITLEAADKEQVALDTEDLALVEEGRAGMRYWVAKEWDLVERSRKRREKREERKKKIKRASLGVVILILVTAIFGVTQWNASKNLLKDLAESSLEYRSAALINVNPTLAINMAKRYYDNHQPDPKPHVLENLRNVLSECLKKETYYTALLHETPLTGLAISPDEKYFVTATRQTPYVRLWNHDGNLARVLESSLIEIEGLGFQDSSSIVIHYNSGASRLIDLQGRELQQGVKNFSEKSDLWNSADGKLEIFKEYSKDQDRGSYAHYSFSDSTINTLLQRNDRLNPTPLALPADVLSEILNITPNGERVAYLDTLGRLGLYMPGSQERQLIEQSPSGISSAAFCPTRNEMAALASNGEWRLISLEKGQIGSSSLKVSTKLSSLKDLTYDPKGKLMMIFDGEKKELLIWHLGSGVLLHRLRDGQDYLRRGFSQEGRLVFKQLPDGTVHVWDLRRKAFNLEEIKDEWVQYFETPLSGSIRFTQSSQGKLRLLSTSVATQKVELRNLDGSRVNISAPLLPNAENFIHKNGFIAQLGRDSLRPINFQNGNTVSIPILEPFTPTIPWDQMAMTPDAKHVVLANQEEMLFWRLRDPYSNVKDSAWVRSIEDFGRSVSTLSVNNDLDVFLAKSSLEAFWISHQGKGDTIFSLYPKFSQAVTASAIGPENNYIAVARGSQLEIWDTRGRHLESCPVELSNIQDITFEQNQSNGKQSILVVTGKGIYRWHLLQPLIGLMKQLQLDKEPLQQEVDREISNFNGQIIYGFSDYIFYKKLLIYFFMLAAGVAFIRDWVDRFDRKDWRGLGILAPIYAIMLLLPLILISEASSKHELHTLLNGLITCILIPFLVLCATEAKKLWPGQKGQALTQAAFGIIGFVGYVFIASQDSLSFFSETLVFWALMTCLLLAFLLVPAYAALKQYKKKRKFWYYVLLVPYFVQILIYLVVWVGISVAN